MVGCFASVRGADGEDEALKERPFLVRHKVSCQAGLHRRCQLESYPTPEGNPFCQHDLGDWIEFYALIENKIYVVRLDVAKDGSGSILTSHLLDLTNETNKLFNDDISGIMYSLRLPYTDESYDKWQNHDIEERSEEDLLTAGRLMRKFFEKNPLALYPLIAACEDFDGTSKHLGLFNLLCHEGSEEERKARLQCYIAIESLMTNNKLSCFRTVSLQRVSKVIEQMLAEQTN